MSAAVNSGSLTVIKGVLLANGAVTGTGSVKIGGGVADFAGAFSQNVAFTSTTGVLELAKSQTYTGQISGFSKTGGTSLDLVDIGFAVATTHASFTGSTISGTLTITDGTHTAHIGLVGDYTASSWFVSSDGHGGTTVIDPPHAPAPSGRIAQGLIGAAASFGVSGSPGGTGARAADTWWERQTVLSARPGYMA
jgi:hypothetical protein